MKHLTTCLVLTCLCLAASAAFANGVLTLPATGQKISYAAGDDGALRRGEPFPAPRFSSNVDGTATDHLTGLTWARDANLISSRDAAFDSDGTMDGAVTWQHALDYVNKLNAENYLGQRDWRLPNRNELLSLIDRSAYSPALSAGHPFTKVQNAEYWSSSSNYYAWNVNLDDGVSSPEGKWDGNGGPVHFVLPVRGQSLSSASESTRPTITEFDIPSQSANLIVPVNTFAATDDTLVSAYCLSEIGSPSNCTWFSAAPTYHSFSSPGSKALYAFARDSYGNVSLSSAAALAISTRPYPAGYVALPATGQLASYAAGDDGHLRLGVPQPAPRFRAAGDGSVSDDLTGLSWVRDANLITTRNASFDSDGSSDGAVNWQRALDYVAKLNSESYLGYSDWRLPNRNELLSLIDRSSYSPALSAGHPFTKVQQLKYWTSSSNISSAWTVNLDDGLAVADLKSEPFFVWPVRGTSLAPGGDSTAPAIGSFSVPAASTHLIVPIANLAGTDNGKVSAYCVSETSSAASCTWLSEPPSYFVFASPGAKTLYGFVRDEYGNVSPAASASLTIALSPYPSGVVTLPATGQSTSYVAGDDGFLKLGGTLPAPRYTANTDGTVTDNLTGLSWGKDANLITTRNASFDSDGARDGAVTWQHALDYVAKLNSESYLGFKDWRLPNRNELLSQINRGRFSPALSAGHPFSKVQNDVYWSSSSSLSTAWTVNLDDGLAASEEKSGERYLWPVRGGVGETATVGALALSVSPTASQVPGVPLNTSGLSQTITLTNSGSSQLAVTSVAPTGTNAANFSVAAGTGTGACPSLTPTLAAGATCTLRVNFAPTRFGASSAGVLVSLSGSGSQSGTVIVTGNGTDVLKPTSTITTPVVNLVDALYLIEGTAADTGGSGLAKVELQLDDGTLFLASDGSFDWSETWLSPTGLDSWRYALSGSASSQLVNGKSYTIKVRSTDYAGNVGTQSFNFTKVKSLEVAYSKLDMECSASMILQGGKVTVSGKLTRLPDNGADLSGLEVQITVTAPNGSVRQLSTSTSDLAGHFRLDGVDGFTLKGPYTVKAEFAGNSFLNASSSGTQTVLVGTRAGYAVVIQGKIASEEGLASHSKTANRIYRRLKGRGFSDDTIYYLSYQNAATAQAAGITVDAVPSRDAVRTAITTWASGKLKEMAAPFYIIMVDHGARESFIINTETISPSDLKGWLETLEGSLAGYPAAQEKRIVVNGSCFSGGFIPALSKAGRIIISSAAANEESYKGPSEPDGIRSGEFFLDALFQQLGSGYSLGRAFEGAAQLTRVYTRKGGSANGTGLALDGAVQHPLLDDNGSGSGSNMLSDLGGDGAVARTMYLGVGETLTNAVEASDIIEVTPTLHLPDGTSSASLRLGTVGSHSMVSSAWAEVRTPSLTLSPTGTSTGQLDLTLDKQLMSTKVGTSTGWELPAPYPGFTAPGTYEVYYYTRDALSGVISPMKRSLVYKNKAGNSAPGSFALVAPADGAAESTVLLLEWGATTDPEGDPLSYTVLISTDPYFGAYSKVFRKEEILDPLTEIGPELGLADLTTYYWKVQAVDRYGAVRDSSQIRSFTTNNTNGLGAVIKGRVTSADSGAAIGGGMVQSSTGSVKLLSGGSYLLIAQTGSITLTASAPGYTPISTTLAAGPGDFLTKSFSLTGAVLRHTVSASATGVGSVTPQSQSVDHNGQAVFSVVPATGQRIGTVSGSCPAGSFSGESYRTGAITSNCTVGFSFVPLPVLQVTLAGTGGGSVNSNPAGIACVAGSCSASFAYQTPVRLMATPASDSLFAGWSGSCTNLTGDCTVTMDAAKSVSANFTAVSALRLLSSKAGYASTQNAYNAAASGDVIQVRDLLLTGNLLADKGKTLTLSGGYDAAYAKRLGFSVLKGVLRIRSGKLSAAGIKVR